ncbi:hypothetical protein SLEP1_g17138 [Rubroshorea leprosula]|uniref:Uncharacterized protein n=1 Tax=Rubroshorea leprosula TaxID=152421 RepID=A0AAV5J3R7_9ROSI|nr:hypothetical protein SLEP1_g17138 [Rubroshorea leprosula]
MLDGVLANLATLEAKFGWDFLNAQDAQLSHPLRSIYSL